ncbi:hypothetical protein [uncultured Winogradskyella sp.]|uniref:hypothetical protein n=1 Tax=uncultured Winogradskyella sp. TaxID=395353 RepID=UPI002625734F|nr:hypothetical protein [uncultured Winogradskyella sp.]
MKTFTILFLLFCSINLIGQEKLKINIDNPEPRVGQKVNFTIEIDFLNDYFKDELGESIELTGSSSVFAMSSKDFQRVIIFNEAKKHEIGPFNFEFNGKKYTTDSIEVNVQPELPIEKGLWIRLAEFEGEHYIILEQLIENISNKTDNENGGYSHTIGGILPEGIEFAGLNENLTDGIELSNYSSSSNTLTAKDADFFDVGFSYSIKKYRVQFDDDFDGSYIISEKDFENLPEETELEKIELKR